MSAAAASQWWALGLSEEITANQPHARQCQDDAIVLFRDRAGRVHALEDRCAHRRAALSLGRVTEAGFLQCGYHGWTYEGESGRCVAIPNLSADERVPPTYAVRRYPCIEHGGFVYVRTGGADDSAAAPPRFAELPSAAQHRSLLIALPHERFVGALLDGPWLLVQVAGVTLVVDHRLGDPAVVDGRVSAEFAADWTARIDGLTESPPDYALLLRVTATPVTGMTTVELLDQAEQVLLQAQVACYPRHPCVTAVSWRHTVTAAGATRLPAAALTLRDQIAANGLLTLGTLGLDAWREQNLSQLSRR